MSKKKASKPKPATKPAPKAGNVISLDALLGNWPTIELGGIQFEGRHFNQTEKAAWLTAEDNDDAEGQLHLLVEAINARGGDITLEWAKAQPDVFIVAIVQGLYGAGWPGDNPK